MTKRLQVGGAKIHRPGTVVAKALESLTSGQGEIFVLLSRSKEALMRPILAFSCFCLAMAILFPRDAAAQRPSSPAIVFDNGIVRITNITPGADVYLFGVSREAKGYYNQIATREIVLHDSTRSGRVEYPLGQPVPLRSIWLAVDLSSGSPVAAAPPDYFAHAVALDDRHLKKDADGDIARLSYEGTVVQIIVVRPGAGIWGGPVGLHTKSDESKPDPNDPASNEQRPVISSAHLPALAGTVGPAPAKLKKGDIVFMMNSYRAQYSVGVLGGQK